MTERRLGLAVYGFSLAAHAVPWLLFPGRILAASLSPDSHGYLDLAAGPLFDHARTPGYPLFLWALQRGGGLSLAGVLGAQTAIISMSAPLVAILARRLMPDRPRAAWLAGGLSAVSFTGITLGYRILAEALFAPLVIASVLALVVGIQKSRSDIAAAASVLAGVAFFVKPIFLIWCVLAPALALLLDRRREGRLVRIACATLPAAAVAASWTLVVDARYGVMTPSTIGSGTIYEYLGARTLALAEIRSRGSSPAPVLLERRRAELRESAGRFRESTPALVAHWRQRSMEIVSAHPGYAALALAQAAIESSPRPFARSELPVPAPRVPYRALGVLMTTAFWIAALAGAGRLWRQGHVRLLLALGMLFGAFVLVTATSGWQGGRLMFPVEWILCITAAAGLAGGGSPAPHANATSIGL